MSFSSYRLFDEFEAHVLRIESARVQQAVQSHNALVARKRIEQGLRADVELQRARRLFARDDQLFEDEQFNALQVFAGRNVADELMIALVQAAADEDLSAADREGLRARIEIDGGLDDGFVRIAGKVRVRAVEVRPAPADEVVVQVLVGGLGQHGVNFIHVRDEVALRSADAEVEAADLFAGAVVVKAADGVVDVRDAVLAVRSP